MDLPASFDEFGLPAPTTGPSQPTTGPSSRSARPTRPVDLARWWKSLDDPLLDSLVERAIRSGFDLRIALARLQDGPVAGVHRHRRLRARAGRRARTSTWPPAAGAAAAPTPPAGACPGRCTRGPTPTDFRKSRRWPASTRRGRSTSSATSPRGRGGPGGRAGFRRGAQRRPDQRRRRRGAHLRRGARPAVPPGHRPPERGIQRRTLDLVRVRFKQGLTNDLDVALAERQLSGTLAAIAPLEAAVRSAQRRVAVLVGSSRTSATSGRNWTSRWNCRPRRRRWRRGCRWTCCAAGPTSARPSGASPPPPRWSAWRRPTCSPASPSPARPASRGRGWAAPTPSTASSGRSAPALYWPFLDFGQLDAIVQARKFQAQQLLAAYQRRS